MSLPGGWTLRPATPADGAALAALWRESFLATFGALYTAEDLQVFLDASYGDAIQTAEIAAAEAAHRLAYHGEKLVGAAQTGPLKLPIDPGPERAWELKRLYLLDAAKGAGLADALMAWAKAEARARGAAALYLGVWSENVRAQRFYTRHGFVKVGGYLFPVGRTLDDEWILRAALTDDTE